MQRKNLWNNPLLELKSEESIDKNSNVNLLKKKNIFDLIFYWFIYCKIEHMSELSLNLLNSITFGLVDR